jgi:dihydrodipicolinate synthase/N-acetylneuraminate lyase
MSVKISSHLQNKLRNGMVIPANPTALTKSLKLDERRQRALLRYYLDSGSGGLALGVHTSQFEIRKRGLYQPLLELGEEEISSFCTKNNKEIFRIAGVIGEIDQAVGEAQTAAGLGYHAALLSLAALQKHTNEQLIEHCKAIAEVMPLVGFYLNPFLGGRILDVDFWREFSRIPNVVAIKIAPFDRYDSIDVIRGVAESGRANQIALYTGNDDTIVSDLLTKVEMPVGNKIIKKRIVGGLLGHWAVWNKKAVEQLDQIHNASPSEVEKLLTLGVKVTDANAALFDSRNGFKGSIAGIHEVLIRQGLLEANYTINPKEVLSSGQKEEIDRVYKLYPELNDDAYVAENLDTWLR